MKTTRTVFLQTVSAAALAVVLSHNPDPARADELSGELIFEFHGGFLSGNEQPWAQRFGPGGFPDFHTERIAPDTSLGGTVGYRAPATQVFHEAGHAWDIGVFARFGVSNTETEGGVASPYFNIIGGYYPTFYTAGKSRHQEEHLIVDFEARRDVGLGGDLPISTKFMAGFRFAYFNADTETKFVYLPTPVPYTLRDNRESQFIGAGPRVGFDSNIPISGNLSIDLSGSAALLFGRRNTSNNTVGGNFFISTSFVRESFKVVPTLEGSAAFRFQMPGTSASLSIGVRTDAWFDVYDQRTSFNTFTPANIGRRDADRISISPFARLTVPLGGGDGDAHTDIRDLVLNGPDGAADRPPAWPIVEVGLSGGHNWRSGTGLNLSAGPDNELEEFPFGRIDGLFAARPLPHLLIQAEIAGEETFGDNKPDGVPDDDTYEGGFSGGGQLAFISDPFLLAIFGAAGETDIATAGAPNQDADHWMFGGQTRLISEHGSFTAQVGVFDTDADDPETISDAVFGRAIAQLFFNDGNSVLQVDVAYVVGEQDPNDFLGVNPTEIISWGMEFEHGLDFEMGNAAASLFFGYQGSKVIEQSTVGGTDNVIDHAVVGGLRIRLGPVTPASRERNTAPRMPNVNRWVGAVPAVD